ncbi:energy-coupling factor transporter transmembrane protein EcfT [Faecalicatena contorta]|uniref:energy-coupling factor transporter transmembrane component T n=1 Tax=Faecalicatena contorta TaxID=39482 RepID=UPI001F32E99E|nr:energy-coupling factor transporter transmembrane component T [Faecalicatena contorta]MCF2679929.1 energy-coupling factor transporter transmembrane protein EcfT [Faecalicatena contorta]
MEKTYIEKIQIHKTNKLAGLHPATKFFVVIMYTICTFVLSSVHLTKVGLSLLLIPWFLVVLILCGASGAMKKSIKALKAVAVIALVIFLVQTFIVPGGDVLFRFGFLRICEKGLKTAVSLSFLIMDIAGIFVWLFQTTENKEIARALEESGLNYKTAYVFTSSLQMINILSGNSKTIMNAQRARGVETEGNVIVRAKAFFPTLVPLVLGAVIGSEERVLTLEARGFSMQGEKTHLFNLEKSGAEGTMKILWIVVTALIIVGRVALWML